MADKSKKPQPPIKPNSESASTQRSGGGGNTNPTQPPKPAGD